MFILWSVASAFRPILVAVIGVKSIGRDGNGSPTVRQVTKEVVSQVRWDTAMSNVEEMETKWEDAFHTVMAFVQFELAKVKQNGGRTEVLRECQKTIIHCFSLMNALALTSLSTCVGWAQYKKHNESVTSYTYFRPVLGCIDADLCK